MPPLNKDLARYAHSLARYAHVKLLRPAYTAHMRNLFLSYVGMMFVLAGCSSDPVSSNPPPAFPAALQADLQATLDQAVADGNAPGVSIYVSGPEGTWSGMAGIANIDGNIPMAPGDRFRTGSILKTLVATAVLQSVEKGALGLHDKLQDRLPMSVSSKIQQADIIDVEMLLSHRSGIPEWVTPAVKQMVVSDPKHIWSLDEVLGVIEGQALLFNPGESYSYSNTNYMLLGEILATVEGKSFRDVLRERVITPAGMSNTALPEPGDVECPDCAHGYISMDTGMLDGTNIDPSMAGASGGHAMISTPEDLTRLLKQLRAGALFDSSATADMMFAFQPAVDAQTHQTGYGLGMMQLESEGEIVIGHLGGTAGYSGFMFYIPSTDRYVSGFINIMGDPEPVLTPVIGRLAEP